MFGSSDYPVPGFHFKVLFSFTLGMADTSFQSVSGLSADMEVEEYREGCENEQVLYLPKKINHPNLVLKRGVSSFTSPLFLWLQGIFSSDFRVPMVPMPLQIHLLNEKHLPSRVWQINDALPVKWQVDEFNSTKNEVAIETIEMKYSTSLRIF